MENNKLIYISPEWDKIEIDCTDKNINETMKILVRLCFYMGYNEDIIKEGLDKVAF